MPRQRLEVESKPWPEFLKWFGPLWEPGQHISVVAPTGAGKTTLVANLLQLRRYVLAIDPKGGDSSLSALGWDRLDKWPGDRNLAKTVFDNDKNGLPSRYLVGPIVQRHQDHDTLREVCRQALDGSFNMGGWTCYVDEGQIACDPRMMNLKSNVDRLLISARDKGLSLVMSYQAPAWVTPHAGRMSTWMAVSYTRDVDTLDKLASNLGRSRAEVRGMIQGLDPYTWLFVGRDPRAPVVVTKPPPMKEKEETPQR